VTGRRRRGLLLICVSLATGGLAASQVHEHERQAAEELGPSVDVMVAARDLRTGSRIRRAALALRRVPARFVPPGALGSPADVLGARTSAPVPAGGYLTAELFQAGDGAERDGALRRGERAVTIEVAGGAATAALAAGTRVDVLVSSETGAGGGRTTMALAGAELLHVADSGRYKTGSDKAAALATLRVSLRQAIYLTAADNFATEIRLLPHPPGDHSRAGGAVSQGQL
jgi:pilus assembly protein CpaB